MRIDARHVLKLAGPPGTGKTTTLLNLVDQFLGRGVDPEAIVFTTFTRAGAYEARDRACLRFNLPPERLPYFRTLHSLCYQEVGGELMQQADWIVLAKTLGLYFTVRQNTAEEGVPRGVSKGDQLSSLWNLSRVTRIPLPEIFERRQEWFVMSDELSFQELEHFAASVASYKETHGKCDYTDILERYLVHGSKGHSSHVIVDEAQDLSAIQWEVVHRLCHKAERVVVAGDDDQCIHEWNGASPRHFIELESTAYEVLPRSWRLPLEVRDLSLGIIKRVQRRLEKSYLARTEEADPAAVRQIADLGELDVAHGSWLMLSRNRCFLEEYAQLCRHKGCLFTGVGMQANEADILEAIDAWKQLLAGHKLPAGRLKRMYAYLSQRDRVTRGYKKQLAAVDDGQLLGWKDLVDRFGLVTDLPWPMALDLIPEETRLWFQVVEKNEGLRAKPRIEITTIHGAKGKEADNVVIRLDMATRSWEAYQVNPDQEHRVWYVGFTRPRKQLFILQPSSDLCYTPS